LDAVDDLNAHIELADILRGCLRSIPDLERMIARIHSGTAKLPVFLNVLQAFDNIWVLLFLCLFIFLSFSFNLLSFFFIFV
jgi:DNA mismatch repair protein MSH6